jgi:cob(I)alamin adenosyltransferase
MEESPFEPPRMGIDRVYTRRGDGGETALAGGQRVPKDAPRIEAYGTVDELNACLGAARVTLREMAEGAPRLRDLDAIVLRVQHELFNLGSMLATLPEDLHPRQARVTAAEVAQLESEMDRMLEELPPLRSFLLPGGSRIDAELHVSRTVCRRAERVTVALERLESVPTEAVRYLNRLSDALFVWSRWASHVLGTPETLWDPNQSATGRSGG